MAVASVLPVTSLHSTVRDEVQACAVRTALGTVWCSVLTGNATSTSPPVVKILELSEHRLVVNQSSKDATTSKDVAEAATAMRSDAVATVEEALAVLLEPDGPQDLSMALSRLMGPDRCRCAHESCSLPRLLGPAAVREIVRQHFDSRRHHRLVVVVSTRRQVTPEVREMLRHAEFNFTTALPGKVTLACVEARDPMLPLRPTTTEVKAVGAGAVSGAGDVPGQGPLVLPVTRSALRIPPLDLVQAVLQEPRMDEFLRLPRPCAAELRFETNAENCGLLQAFDWTTVATSLPGLGDIAPIPGAHYAKTPEQWSVALRDSKLGEAQSLLVVWSGRDCLQKISFVTARGKKETRSVRAVPGEVELGAVLPGQLELVAQQTALHDRRVRIEHCDNSAWQQGLRALDQLSCRRLRRALSRAVLAAPGAREVAAFVRSTASLLPAVKESWGAMYDDIARIRGWNRTMKCIVEAATAAAGADEDEEGGAEEERTAASGAGEGTPPPLTLQVVQLNRRYRTPSIVGLAPLLERSVATGIPSLAAGETPELVPVGLCREASHTVHGKF